VAFEAQLAPITDDDITARTGCYRADGIDVGWVSTGRWPP
jgi:competence CoiA-like predicted nuclease